MRIGAIIGAIVVVALVGFGIYMIDIDQTQEAALPEVTVEGGQLPKFDAEVGDVDIEEKQVTVTVPELEVTPPEEEDVAQN